MTTEAIPIQERVAMLEEAQNHLATKEDLERLRGDVHADMERLRGDIHTDMERLRGDMRVDTERLRTDMEKMRADLLVAVERGQVNTVRWTIGTILATAGLVFSIALAVEKLF